MSEIVINTRTGGERAVRNQILPTVRYLIIIINK